MSTGKNWPSRTIDHWRSTIPAHISARPSAKIGHRAPGIADHHQRASAVLASAVTIEPALQANPLLEHDEDAQNHRERDPSARIAVGQWRHTSSLPPCGVPYSPESAMQFYLNGYRPGDPATADADPSVAERSPGLPEEVDVL